MHPWENGKAKAMTRKNTKACLTFPKNILKMSKTFEKIFCSLMRKKKTQVFGKV